VEQTPSKLGENQGGGDRETPGEPSVQVVNLGRMAYARAYEEQLRWVDLVLQARESPRANAGAILIVEHDPVITVSRRASAKSNLVATADMLARLGVAVEETDRGGDITYHGPGQLVAYPILDLNLLNLGLHDYMRLLEESVIQTLAQFGVRGVRDPAATGVWVPPASISETDAPEFVLSAAKVCAMGVRVKRWISMHGLAINVSTNLDHFKLIVPCGLAGRPVTSLHAILGESAPSFTNVSAALVHHLSQGISAAWQRALRRRRDAANS
jgi:lipoyl(octanoyl) transferase